MYDKRVLATGKVKYEGRIVDFEVLQDDFTDHEPQVTEAEIDECTFYTSREAVEYGNVYPHEDKPVIGKVVDDLFATNIELDEGLYRVYGWYWMPSCGSDPMQVMKTRNVRKADFLVVSEHRGVAECAFRKLQSIIEGLYVNIWLDEDCECCGQDKHVDSICLVDGLFVKRESFGGPMNLWALSKSETIKFIEDHFGAKVIEYETSESYAEAE